MTEIERIDIKLKILKRKRSDIDAQEKELMAEKVDLLFENHDKIYRIQCDPSRSDHSAHSIGVFSTYKKANSFIPKDKHSHDSDDNCTWNYSVISKEATREFMAKLDEPLPSHFPYCGW